MQRNRLFSTLMGTASAAALAFGMSGTAYAGNIFLTGHDDDFHQSTAAKAAVTGAMAFVRAGSSLPVLTFDAGSELTSLLTSLAIPFHNVNPTGAISDSLFDHSKYSAFAVASITTCGGCDNPVGTGTTLATHSAAITAFFNAGGGIMGLAGATDAHAYDYVPKAATNPGGSPPRTGYVTTADGIALGIPAVNGDTTHNFFSEPGTAGLSSAYKVTERLGDPVTGTPESVATADGTIVCTEPGIACTIIVTGVPEPATLALFGAGLVGLGLMRRRRQTV